MMSAQRHSETIDQQSNLLNQPSLSLVSNDQEAIADSREENLSEQLGYRFGRFLSSATRSRQSQQPERLLTGDNLLNSLAKQMNVSPANFPAWRQDDHAVLDIQTALTTLQPVSNQFLELLSQDVAADGLRELRDTVFAQYGLKQSREPHIAEAILGGAFILGLALNGDLSSIALHGTEAIEAVTTILQFALRLLVGSYQAELLAAVAGSLALLLYSRWNSRNYEQATLSLQAS
jgi:hypothetical protein